jgi:hypothetical protein
MKAFKYIPLLLLLTACVQDNKSTGTNDTAQVLSRTKNDSINLKVDTAYFDKPVAIIIEPSGRLIAKTKSKMEDGAYNTVIDDNMYYVSESKHYLDSVKANKVMRESEGAIKFKTTTGQIYVMKLDTLFFGIMLFNGKDKPIMADMTYLQGDYEQYMRKR